MEEERKLDPDAEEHPVGSLVLLGLYVLLIVALWGWAYLLLLGRS